MSVIDAAHRFPMRVQRTVPGLLPTNVAYTTVLAVRWALHSANDPYQGTSSHSALFLSRLERVAGSDYALRIKSFELDFKALGQLAQEMASQWIALRKFSIPRELSSQELAQIAVLFPGLWGISFYVWDNTSKMIDDLAQFVELKKVTLDFQGANITSDILEDMIGVLGERWDYLNLNNLSGYESLDAKKPLVVAQVKGYGVEYGNGCSDIALSSPAIHEQEVSQEREVSA